MKILKPGKVKMLKCICPNCGCEFLYEYFGNVYFTESSRVICPQEGCKDEVFLRSGTPYEEPKSTQIIKERLYGILLTANPSATTTELTDHLIANGVTIQGEQPNV